MNFGMRLKRAREDRVLTQKQLGRMVGVSGTAIGNYENGVSSPKEEIMLRLFDALGVSPNYLFQDSFSVPKQSIELSQGEVDFLSRMRGLDQESRQCIFDLVEKLSTNGKHDLATEEATVGSALLGRLAEAYSQKEDQDGVKA